MLETIGLITVVIYIMGWVLACGYYADECNASGKSKQPLMFLELFITWPRYMDIL